jgi:hypothetical protein
MKCIILFVVIIPSMLLGQGTIRGTVKTASGSVVPNATTYLVSQDESIKPIAVLSDSSGGFSFSTLANLDTAKWDGSRYQEATKIVFKDSFKSVHLRLPMKVIERVGGSILLTDYSNSRITALSVDDISIIEYQSMPKKRIKIK